MQDTLKGHRMVLRPFKTVTNSRGGSIEGFQGVPCSYAVDKYISEAKGGSRGFHGTPLGF